MIAERRIFVTGTHTDIGKTVCSALLVKILGADYWKAVQCGSLEDSDTHKVRALVGTDHQGDFHPERFALEAPQSVHIAARLENCSVSLEDFKLPETQNTLIVEGAGGCLVPLNEHETMIDLAKHLDLPVVLVTRCYLGSYNHTLLSIEALHARGIRILGLILNGGDEAGFGEFISRKTGVRILGIIPQLAVVSSTSIASLADEWRG